MNLSTNDTEMKSMLLFAASLAAFTGFSQSESLAKVINGLKSANMSSIESELMNEVDLTVFEFEDFCSKKEVTAQLRSFFSQHKPSSFTPLHDGNNGGSEVYKIGELTTSTGTYRVTIFMDKSPNGFKVSQLKIE